MRVRPIGRSGIVRRASVCRAGCWVDGRLLVEGLGVRSMGGKFREGCGWSWRWTPP